MFFILGSWVALYYPTALSGQAIEFSNRELHTMRLEAERERDTLALARVYQLIAKHKMPRETEQDSILYYVLSGKKFAEGRSDSLVFEFNDHLIYWHSHQRNFGEALRYAEENMTFAKAQNDSFRLMRVHLSYGDLYDPERLNRPQGYLDHTRRALEIATQRIDTVHMAIGHGFLANAYLMIDSLRYLVPYHAKLAIQLSDYEDWLSFLKIDKRITLGQYYLYRREYQAAQLEFERAINQAQTDKAYGYLGLAYLKLADTHEMTGQFAEALTAYKQSKRYHDSLFTERSQERIGQLRVEYETELKDLEVKRLRREEENRAAQLRKQRALLIGIVLVAAIFVVLLVWALGNFRQRLESNRKLLVAERELVKSRSQFFTQLSHEFRTPLTAILGGVRKIKDPQVKKVISRNAESLLDLANQMLELQKLEAGRLEIRYQCGDVVAYLEYLTESFHSLAEQKSIRINFHADPEVIQMNFDTEKLRYVFVNLLSNALKFTSSPGKIYISLRQEADRFLLRVRDTGPGVPSNDLPHIFKRFYQGENGKMIGGTGIGLTLVRDLTELLGGTARAYSQPNKGTTFFLNFPITTSPLPRVSTEATPDAAHQLPEGNTKTILLPSFPNFDGRPRILIVDDSPDVLEYLADCLSQDYELLKAHNGTAAYTLAQAEVPDLVISDVMMPGTDGYALCRQLKATPLTAHIPIVLLTARAAETDKISGLKEGADAYLTKPFREEELLLRVRNLLRLREKLRQRWEDGPSSVTDKDPNQVFLRSARDILLQRIDDAAYTVEIFSRDLGLSRSQLHRKMVALTGLSTSHFMNEIRLLEARKLLMEGAYNVSEVAYAVGFQYPNYFARLYAKKFGHPPNETRKKR